MRPSDHLNFFLKRVKSTRRLLARQVTFFNRNLLPKSELEAIYELAFSRVFVSFENELVELLKTNMMMDIDASGKVRSNFPVVSREKARRLLLGTNRYFQILPLEQMEKIAKVYLKNGGPFVQLDGGQKTSIAKAHAIRNHIAHRSPDSKASFQSKVLATVTLPKKSSSPGYYLRNNLTVNITYFDHHVAEVGRCLSTLCALSP